MKVKRIFAPDMRQAMKRVRDEIGPQAVIVSNHRIAGGVEVVAAHEQDFERAQSQFKQSDVVRNKRDSQVDILTGATRRPAASQLLEQEKIIAQNKVLKARGRAVSEYVENTPLTSGVANLGGRNQQLEDSYDDDLETILASLKKKKEGRRQPLTDSDMNQERVASRLESAELKQDAEYADESRSDYQESYSRPAVRKEAVIDAPGKNDRSAGRYTQRSASADDDLIDNMQQEIDQLKKMLSGQLPGAYKAERGSVSNSLVIDKLAHRFEQIGLESVFENKIRRSVDPGLDLNRAWRKSLAQLVEMVPVINHDFISRGGMIAFVGPTGIGKTTTIGKLAAKYVLEHGSAGVALVTTDSYRIAAHDQLKTFGRILDIPVRAVDEKNSLAEVLNTLKNKKLVLIDTAGLGASDAASQQQSFMLESVPMNLKKLLVLSCSSQKQVLADAYDCYSPLGLNGCVLTKIDESGNMGAALTLVAERNLPVAYIASGQKIPDDIHVAHKNDLVSRAVLTAQKSREREKIRRNAAI
ncbi:MAG: flagellar biosynthesis protein FlhF [Oceanospirillaceae bacterium]